MKTLAGKNRSARHGFALVVTLMLMVLLSIVAEGLLTLSSVALRTSGLGQTQAIARANARLAMMLAIGQLQNTAGPDQVVTGSASLANSSPEGVANPGWSGVWSSIDKNAKPVWLVSGDQPDPAKTLSDSDSTVLAKSVSKPGVAASADPDLRAPWVKVANPASRGRYAYWIGDEGTKARVDLARVAVNPATERERFVRSQSPQEPGIFHIDKSVWGDFETAGAIDKQALISMGTVALAARESAAITRDSLPRYYLNDLTTGGFGLPVNVRDGGMKADLSLLFDSTQLSKTSMIRRYLGGTPSLLPGSDRLRTNGAKVYGFSIDSNPDGRRKFYLSDQISKSGSLGVGPNWGILWNYAHLWENVIHQQAPLVGVTPRVESDLRNEDWLPYTMSGTVEHRRDHQHLNSSLAPVLSTFQMGFRLKAKQGPDSSGGGKQYYAQLEIKPVVGLWNPYNVTIKPQRYKFEWAAYPFLRFDYQKPPLSFSSNFNVITTYMRERWAARNTGGSTIPTPDNPQGSSWIRLMTDPVNFQPGEIRLFSVNTVATIEKTNNKLVSGWGENGAFVIDLLRADGTKVLIPQGYVGWFGDVDMQDTHQQETISKFPNLNPTAAATWITMKAISNTSNGDSDTGSDVHLTRLTNLWNGGTNRAMGRPFMPEQIISSRTATDTGKTKHRIEDLARAGDVAHIGTWSFFSRSTTQLLDSKQGLRGWVDTNPRALVGLPKFDGSSVSGAQRSGWNTISPFIGGSHDTAPRGQVGDGDGGNRGLIAEGGSGEPEPQAILAGGRYQGFGGNSNTATGQNHVIVYDVPRAPLQSLGQFQHAELSRYNFEPGFVAGNSYANPRIPLNQTVANGFADPAFNLVDVSHEVNNRLWDQYFFSTLGSDYVGGTGLSLDNAVDVKKLLAGKNGFPIRA